MAGDKITENQEYPPFLIGIADLLSVERAAAEQ